MWFMMILWRSFRGMWRLVIGLIIGVILYIVTFTNPGLEWIFNGVFEFSHYLVNLLREQEWFGQYEKWNNLVKPGDRLPLILYVLVGRFIWLMFEAILFTFPYWLIVGRNTQKKTADSSRLASAPPLKSAPTANTPPERQGMAPVMGHSGADNAAPASVAAPAGAIAASAVAGNEPVLEGAQNAQAAQGEDLERHIDEALARIKQVGEQPPNNQ